MYSAATLSLFVMAMAMPWRRMINLLAPCDLQPSKVTCACDLQLDADAVGLS